MRAFLSLLIVGLAMAMANFGVNSETITITDEHLSKQFVAQTFVDLLLPRVLEKREQLGVIPEQDQDVKIPILPPTTITLLPFEDYRIVFDNQLMQGFYEHENTELKLSFRDNLSFGLNGSFITVRYAFNMDELLAVAGNYSMNLNLNFTYLAEEIPDFPITVPDEGLEVPIEGWGGYELALKNFAFTVALAFEIMPNGTIVSVNALVEVLSLGVRIHFDNFMFNNEEAEWLLDWINELLNMQLDPVFGGLRETIEGLLNFLVKQLPLEGCNLFEMIRGDLSCLGIPTQPPPPTTPSITTTSSNPSTTPSITPTSSTLSTSSTPSLSTTTTPATTTNSAVNYGGASFGSMLSTLMMMTAVSRLFYARL